MVGRVVLVLAQGGRKRHDIHGGWRRVPQHVEQEQLLLHGSRGDVRSGKNASSSTLSHPPGVLPAPPCEPAWLRRRLLGTAGAT